MSDRDPAAHARELEKKASLAQRETRFADAEPPLGEAIAIWTRLHGPDDIEVLNDEMNLAVAWRRGGDAVRAVAALEHVASRFARCADADAPALLLVAWNNLATAYRDVRALAKARDLWQQCLSAHDAASPGAPRLERARVLDNLAVVLREMGDAANAEPLARRALVEWIALRGENDLDTAKSRAALAAALLGQVRLDEAEGHLRAAFAIVQASGDAVAYGMVLALIAELTVRRGDRDRARSLLEQALGVVSPHLPPHHPDVQMIQANLAALGTPEPR